MLRLSFLAVLALCACAPSGPSPMLATSSLLQEDAIAGQELTDIQLSIRGCADGSALEYRLTKHQGLTSVDTPFWGTTEHADLMLAAADGRTAFDAEADSMLGSWATSLPETTGNMARTLLFDIFAEQLGYCPI